MKKKNKQKRHLFKKTTKVETFHKIHVYTVIVAHGYGEEAAKTLTHCGSNAYYICLGRGTAKKDVLNILGIEGNQKDVIFAFTDENNITDTNNQLNKLFDKNKNMMGFAFTIKLNSIVGKKIYHFLTNTL